MRDRLTAMGVKYGRLLLLVYLVLVVSATTAAAQGLDVLGQARALDRSGKRAEAIQLLRTRIETTPTDDDARELLGLYLSWTAQYDEARRLLQLVVDHRPNDGDALAGLMNVELWSGHPAAAKVLAERGVVLKRGDDRFTLGRERALRAMGAARSWTMSAAYTRDSFSDGRQPWRETQVSLKRYTDKATAIASAVRAERWGLTDTQYQVDLYPKFRPGSYAYLSVGVAPDKILFPHVRMGADLYQSLGGGFEVSAGVRRLQFSTTTTIYAGSLSKYAGNWLLTGRMYYVPDRKGQSSKSYHGSARRYFGADGTSYLGARYSRGFSREEVVSISDFEVLASDTFSLDADVTLGARLRLSAQGVSSRQERALNVSLRQTTLSGAIGFRF